MLGGDVSVRLGFANCDGEGFHGLWVGRIEGHDRQLGKREVARGPKRGERAEERELPIVDPKLLHEQDVVRIRQICRIVFRGCSGVGDELLVKGFEFGIARRFDLAAQPREQGSSWRDWKSAMPGRPDVARSATRSPAACGVRRRHRD